MYYGGINAKVKAMKGRLLKYADYYNISLSKTVSEAAEKLKSNTDYSEAIDEISFQKTINRHIFERRLHFVLNDDYNKIYAFVNELDVKKYLRALFLKREIHIVKQKLCSLFDMRNMDYGFNENDFNIKKYYNDIDIDALVGANSIVEFIESLEGTIFHHILIDAYKDSASLFDLEIAMDFFYYTNLWKNKNRVLSGLNREVASIVNGSEIDMQNIMWIYRLKKYYKLRDENIYKYILPINYKISASTITEMVETEDFKELMDIIYQSPYGYAFIEGQSIESAYYRAMGRAYKLSQIKSSESISVILDYLFRKNIELDNIITVFEGVKYTLPPEEIMKRIRMPYKRYM